jgi:O-antigen/teichoic acid export membrane protein
VRAVLFLAPAVVTRRLDALLAGAIAFAAMRVAVTFVMLARSVGGEHRVDYALLKHQLAYAVPFGIAVVVGACQANLHQYVVSHEFDAATFAVYSVGCLQVPIVDFLMTSAGNVLMVRMTEDLRYGRSEHLVEAWHETVRHLALVLIPLVALLIATADRLIVLLFTERYAASVPVFRLWTLAILLAPFMTDAALRVYAETRFLLFLNTVQLAVIAGLLHWSIATWQLPGAVVVTLAAAVLAKTLALWRVAYRMQVPPAMLAPWRTLAGIAMASTLAAYAARLVVIAHWLPLLPTMILQGTVFGIVYLSCAWQSDWLTANERFAITSRLQRVAGSFAAAEAP